MLSLVPVSEKGIPTDDATWQACCDHRDCKAVPVRVISRGESDTTIQAMFNASTKVENSKVFKSKSVSYVCLIDWKKAADRENIRCVFLKDDSYVNNKRRVK